MTKNPICWNSIIFCFIYYTLLIAFPASLTLITLIVRCLWCIPQYFPTNGILALFTTWSFLHCEWQGFIQHLPLFHDKLRIHCISLSIMCQTSNLHYLQYERFRHATFKILYSISISWHMKHSYLLICCLKIKVLTLSVLLLR